jgi:hypothetical protein
MAPLFHRRGDDRADIAVHKVLDDVKFVTVKVTDRGTCVADANSKEE